MLKMTKLAPTPTSWIILSDAKMVLCSKAGMTVSQCHSAQTRPPVFCPLPDGQHGNTLFCTGLAEMGTHACLFGTSVVGCTGLDALQCAEAHAKACLPDCIHGPVQPVLACCTCKNNSVGSSCLLEGSIVTVRVDQTTPHRFVASSQSLVSFCRSAD